MSATDEARLDWDEDGPNDVFAENERLYEIERQLKVLIYRHTTTTGEHPVHVAELRYLLDPEGETWDPGTPTRAGTCSECVPEDFT